MLEIINRNIVVLVYNDSSSLMIVAIIILMSLWIVVAHYLYNAYEFGGVDWSGQLEWITGLEYWSGRMLSM